MLDDERDVLRRDGAVLRPSLLDDAWCHRLGAAIDRCRADPGPHYGILSRPGLPVVDSDLFRWADDPDIRELTHDSPLPAYAAALLATTTAVLVEDQWFSSEPAATTPSPWHQDDPYYNVDRPFLTIWITLDDVSAQASLRVVPGSHASGVLYAPVEFSASTPTIGSRRDGATAATRFEPVPDVEADPEQFPVRSWDLRAGDAVALDSRTLHATGIRAIDDRPFRRFSTRWAHPETRYADRGPDVANFWHLLPHGLKPGDLLAGPTFPLVTPAQPEHL